MSNRIKKILEILELLIQEIKEDEDKDKRSEIPEDKPAPPDPQIKYLSLESSAKYLGVAKSTLYKLNLKREIPYYKPGGSKIYYKIEDLDNWISKNKVSSQEEINREAERYISKMRR